MINYLLMRGLFAVFSVTGHTCFLDSENNLKGKSWKN